MGYDPARDMGAAPLNLTSKRFGAPVPTPEALRDLDREEEVDLVYFGGLRTGTDGAKMLALGAKAVAGAGVAAAGLGADADEPCRRLLGPHCGGSVVEH